ncbi:tyrosine-type recombinase/integrase [Pseudophaeobacter sp. C1-32P7]|uniref:tyrosine-type recombinase/integrase n=1 Tax=Pseudophaeobacter sp. C1-32P7 TaxID=3098142 RepID=UPI0034D515FD
MVKIELPGLICEAMPSGNSRMRVRVARDKRRRITLKVGLDSPHFMEAYHAARAGVLYEPPARPADMAVQKSTEWLWLLFLEHMEAMETAGEIKAATIKQRQHVLGRFLDHEVDGALLREYDAGVPQEVIVEFLDTLIEKPGARKNTIGALRAMYKFADERGYVRPNPAKGISTTYRSAGGATPWTVDDLKKFRERHPFGTMAHLALTVFMFTACRVSDAIWIGRNNESTSNGIHWLGWQPRKKGSTYVEIPIMPPLAKAIAAQNVTHVDGCYLLSSHGTPFSSSDSFRNRFKTWCREADLPDRSPHGIRKAAGHLLALEGATQHQIMAVHGHSQAATSEIYTKDVERRRLAADAVAKLASMDW